MIVFLTLCYCGVLALLVKLGVIKLTLGWKISPVIWMLFLLIALFIPMQWGAPAGPVNVYQGVVEIIPNVTGEVLEVPVEGLTPIKEGDVLFRIDPVPYQAVVDQLTAQLAEAKQNVKRLAAAAEAANATVAQTDADVELAKADQATAAAAVAAAEAAVREVKGKKEKAVASVEDLAIQVRAAQREYDRMEKLLAQDAAAQAEFDRVEIQVTGLKSQLRTAEVDVRVADDTIARSEADVNAAKTAALSADLKVKQLVETQLPRVRAEAREAELAANSMVGDEHTSVATIRAQLDKAKYDLEETTVRAPSDGQVIGLALRAGQRVGNLPMRSWISFVPRENVTLGVGIPQNALRHVRKGQKAEVTLKIYPGRVFSGTVDEISYISEQGQVEASGKIISTPGVNQGAIPFGVRLRLDDDVDIDVASLPAGAFGKAAIYTDNSKASHAIRRVMMRMEAWVNYVKPW